MPKSVIFIISTSPFHNDQPYHMIRMALSLAVDAKPILILTGDALFVDGIHERKLSTLPDVVGQLRIFNEMVGEAYYSDLIAPTTRRSSNMRGSVAELVQKISCSEALTHIRNADAILSC